MLVGRAGALAAAASLGCIFPDEVPAAELLRDYESGDLGRVESRMPNGRRVRLVGVVFHDWAYPDPDRIDATQDDPVVWREVTRRDGEGGPVYHGAKLRIGPHDDAVLHRSGPKVIGFLPYADRKAVAVLKQAYVDRGPLIANVSWIGVLRAGVWGEAEVHEDDMVGLRLHGVRPA